RQRTDQHDVDAGGDEAGLQGRFEHVAGQASVLADQHRATVGREHARRGARQAQRELDRQGTIAAPATHTVGAEIPATHETFSSDSDRCGGTVYPAARSAAATRIASKVAATSCARTMAAPASTLAAATATLPATR